MIDFALKARDLVEGLPMKFGTLTLRNAQPDTITAIMPHKGQEAVIKKELGAWVGVGESVKIKHGRLLWSGLDQAFLLGSKRVEIKGASCVDVSDGWVFVALEGDNADAVMARLTPLDLRPSKTTEGQVFRSQLGHMMAMIIVTETGFEVGFMSSFAKTAIHEISEAMESVSAIS